MSLRAGWMVFKLLFHSISPCTRDWTATLVMSKHLIYFSQRQKMILVDGVVGAAGPGALPTCITVWTILDIWNCFYYYYYYYVLWSCLPKVSLCELSLMYEIVFIIIIIMCYSLVYPKYICDDLCFVSCVKLRSCSACNEHSDYLYFTQP